MHEPPTVDSENAEESIGKVVENGKNTPEKKRVFLLSPFWNKSAVYAKEVSKGRQRVDNYLGVAAFAPIGVVLRYFTTIPVWKLSNKLLPNALGSFLMGIFVYSPWLSLNAPSAFVGLTTGLCGCFTTFSSWSVDSSVMFARGEIGLAFLSLAVGLVLSSASLALGLLFRSDRTVTEESKLEKYHTYKVEFGIAVVTIEMIVLCSLLATTQSSDLRVLYVGALLAPFGACTRYTLSKHNAGRKIPYFTLLANVVASLASALIVRFVPSSGSTADFLLGFSLGFNGGLSTVSTFVNEIRVLLCLERSCERASTYTLLSLAIAQILALVVLVPP